MRTLVDIPKNEIDVLDDLARKEARSRASLIREAVADFIKKNAQISHEDGFGLWGNAEAADIDGLDYQKRLRREW